MSYYRRQRAWWDEHPHLRKPVRGLSCWIYRHLSTKWGGGIHPPTDQRRIKFNIEGVPRVVQVNNDGFELMIGYPDKWQVTLTRHEARILARFVLWWMVADWFGLRRAVWYWALKMKLHTNPVPSSFVSTHLVLLDEVGKLNRRP